MSIASVTTECTCTAMMKQTVKRELMMWQIWCCLILRTSCQPISPILNFSVTHVQDRIKTGPCCVSFITWWCTRNALSPSKSPFPSEATRIWSVIEILQSLIRRRGWKPLMAGCKSSELQRRIHRRSTSSRWSLKCFRM